MYERAERFVWCSTEYSCCRRERVYPIGERWARAYRANLTAVMNIYAARP